jgi:signal transduction histidine kinase
VSGAVTPELPKFTSLLEAQDGTNKSARAAAASKEHRTTIYNGYWRRLLEDATAALPKETGLHEVAIYVGEVPSRSRSLLTAPRSRRRRRLTQVLINLVGNAIKFTDAGEVAIKAEANNGSFHVSVRDTGPGISAADQAKLFQEFQQADNAITKKKGGTGLGRHIEAHH